ncbi:hypothetical protein Ancab_001457, partial [Ancistrocladus abbreviatus]
GGNEGENDASKNPNKGASSGLGPISSRALPLSWVEQVMREIGAEDGKWKEIQPPAMKKWLEIMMENRDSKLGSLLVFIPSNGAISEITNEDVDEELRNQERLLQVMWLAQRLAI